MKLIAGLAPFDEMNIFQIKHQKHLWADNIQLVKCSNHLLQASISTSKLHLCPASNENENEL